VPPVSSTLVVGDVVGLVVDIDVSPTLVGSVVDGFVVDALSLTLPVSPI
jgi:hypothetical protein